MDATENILDISKLTFEGDFNQQVQEIMNHVRITKKEIENLQLLINDLYHAFSEVWQAPDKLCLKRSAEMAPNFKFCPVTSVDVERSFSAYKLIFSDKRHKFAAGCEVNCFGSIVTGLGIKTSDLDCYVKLPNWLSPPEQSFVLKAKEVLRRRYWIFQRLFAVTAAKIPVVKFYHVPTQRSCDVSFNSSAGVRNSQLVTYLLEIDQRALDLTILVKYWSKVHNLTGNNLMPNYCLIILVIFYLQQKNILPKVMQLQENIKEDYIQNWNTAFCKIDHVNSNNETLYQLLGGFFKYYDTFKYDKCIISPFIGRPVERGLFAKIETLPPEFALYKKNLVNNKQCKPLRIETYWCVQDPFEHNRNSAVAVHAKLAETLLLHFRTAADFYNLSSGVNYLKRLFTKIDAKQAIKNIPKKPVLNHGIKKPYKQNGKLFKQNNFKGKNPKKT